MKKQQEDGPKFTRFPVVSHSAEHLVMGYLLRRNILTYKAPPNNEGYDLICIHPDPRKTGRQIRIQVKSRLATDSDRGVPLKERTLNAFDYLIVVFLNVGYFFQKAARLSPILGAREPEYYTFPASFVRRHLDSRTSWQKMRTRGLAIDRYKNEEGFEQIARALKVPYPQKSGRISKVRGRDTAWAETFIKLAQRTISRGTAHARGRTSRRAARR